MSDADNEPDDELDAEAGQGDKQPANDDAGSRKGLESKKQRIGREQRESLAWWSNVFSTPTGRREIWKLLQGGHTFEHIFACGPSGVPQAEATWFHAGEQAYGQRMYLTFARDHREQVFLMHDENDPAFAKAKK